MVMIDETVDYIKTIQVLTRGVSLGAFSFSIKIVFFYLFNLIWELHLCGSIMKTYDFDVSDVKSSF